MNLKLIITTAVGAAIALPLALSVVTAEAANTPSYQDGDCKQLYQSTTAASENAAKAAWEAKVAGKFGTKWAHWVGAKQKTIVPVPGNGGGTVYRAKAKPCFYPPVL
jgi:hypothetical protein